MSNCSCNSTFDPLCEQPALDALGLQPIDCSNYDSDMRPKIGLKPYPAIASERRRSSNLRAIGAATGVVRGARYVSIASNRSRDISIATDWSTKLLIEICSDCKFISPKVPV